MDPSKLKGAGFFGLAGLGYAYYPYLVMHLGSNMTIFALTASCLGGMRYFAEGHPTINTIDIIRDGEHAGHLAINYQESLLSSKTIIADARNVMSLASLDEDDMGEEDVESNILAVNDYLDTASGERLSGEFVLPADGYRDVRALEWILSIKGTEDSTFDDYNDFMNQNMYAKDNLPKLNKIQLSLLNSGYDRAGPVGSIDDQIDKNDENVDMNLSLMREFYGEEELSKMTPSEFYKNYKKVASGVTF